MNTRITFLATTLILLSASVAGAYPSFQELVDKTPVNGTLAPPPGTYAGPVTIKKSITVRGDGKVVIDGGGKGTVITLEADKSELSGLKLVNSGESHNDIDSGIQVRGNNNIIKDNIIEDCLFGIDLQKSDENIVRRNNITSKKVELGVRGDAIRLWYSMKNKVTHNTIHDSRDTVVWYSRDNLIAYNHATRGRYALHFMYSQSNTVEYNRYYDNTVGIFLMYSDGVHVKHNQIVKSTGPTGMGIGFKETSSVNVEGNDIVYCSTGIYLDLSPFEPDTTIDITSNRIAYNGIGVLFHNDWSGSIFNKNSFDGNFITVSVQGANTAKRNDWNDNYWDNYEGFDRNNDNVGDTTHEIYAYADRIWMDVPMARFFKWTPVLEVIDFLEKLAPFSSPSLVLRDEKPIFHATGVKQ